MTHSKFIEQQIAFALRQVERGANVKDVIRQMGITEQTFLLLLNAPVWQEKSR